MQSRKPMRKTILLVVLCMSMNITSLYGMSDDTEALRKQTTQPACLHISHNTVNTSDAQLEILHRQERNRRCCKRCQHVCICAATIAGLSCMGYLFVREIITKY